MKNIISKICTSISLLIILLFINACGLIDSDTYKKTSNNSGSALTTDSTNVYGTWKLVSIRCDDQPSTIPLFSDVSIFSGNFSGMNISSYIVINSDNISNYRTWTVGSCEIDTMMNFDQITNSNFSASDTNVSCIGSCSGFASACSAGPGPSVNYPYVLNSQNMTVEMPIVIANDLCAPGQGLSSVKFNYVKIN